MVFSYSTTVEAILEVVHAETREPSDPIAGRELLEANRTFVIYRIIE